MYGQRRAAVTNGSGAVDELVVLISPSRGGQNPLRVCFLRHCVFSVVSLALHSVC